MKKILKRTAFTQQGQNAQCQTAAFCCAVSYLAENNGKKNPMLVPEVVEQMGSDLSFTPSKWIQDFWKGDFGIGQGEHFKKIPFHKIVEYINSNIPVIVGMDKWWYDAENNMIEGTMQGHFFVIVGYERNPKRLFIQNPWGEKHFYTCDWQFFRKRRGNAFPIKLV